MRIIIHVFSFILTDLGFKIFLSICFAFFIFELASTTILKTEKISIYPRFKIKGYLFSFFWFLDVIFILATYIEINPAAFSLNKGIYVYTHIYVYVYVKIYVYQFSQWLDICIDAYICIYIYIGCVY
jgi:hypothetical protein